MNFKVRLWILANNNVTSTGSIAANIPLKQDVSHREMAGGENEIEAYGNSLYFPLNLSVNLKQL